MNQNVGSWRGLRRRRLLPLALIFGLLIDTAFAASPGPVVPASQTSSVAVAPVATVPKASGVPSWSVTTTSVIPSNTGGDGLSKATIIAPPPVEPTEDSVSINFEAVELMTLLRYLSQETGKGFILDQNLSGNVTIISPVHLSRKEALLTLESILQVKGYVAIPSGKMYKIVPMAQAKVAGTETRRGNELDQLGENDTLVTQIIPLRKTTVEEAKGVLAALLPPDAQMMSFTPSNTLIITGRSVNIKRAMEILNELEEGRVRPGLDLVTLRYSTATYMKGQLETLINNGGIARGELRGGVLFIPDTRNNVLMVVSAAENFPIVRKLVERLDVASGDTRPDIVKTYALRYADETETVKQLQEILALSKRVNEGGPTASQTVAIDSTKLLAIKRTHSIMVSTRSPEILKRIEVLLVELDGKSIAEAGNVQIIRLTHADAKTLAETLNRLAQDRQKGKVQQVSQQQKSDTITFVAEPSTNSLIVIGLPQYFSEYRPIILSLDVMRPQILVEALIAEVSGNITKSLGIEGGILDAAGTNLRTFGNTNFGLRQQALTTQGMQIGLVKDPLDLQKVKDGDFTEVSKIKALINLYQNNAKFNILSAPRILTTDNEEAKIMVGEVVALPQGFTKDQISGRYDLTNFKYEDVGINLTIKPRVNSSKMVTLVLDQEVKKRQEENLYQFNVPVLTKRQMKTTVTIPNHETIVIGGLVREDKTEVEDRIPFFSSIPLLGKAFRNKRHTVQKTNLLVFLTPHILSTPEEVVRFDQSVSNPDPNNRSIAPATSPASLISPISRHSSASLLSPTLSAPSATGIASTSAELAKSFPHRIETTLARQSALPARRKSEMDGRLKSQSDRMDELERRANLVFDHVQGDLGGVGKMSEKSSGAGSKSVAKSKSAAGAGAKPKTTTKAGEVPLS
ncbi:MAG: secretin N-terminal domain-containing protein [Candidatus Ozemobacteraceae bacterium]